MDETLTPLQRLFLAFIAFFSVLVNRRFAEEVHLARARAKGLLPPAPPHAPRPPERAAGPAAVARPAEPPRAAAAHAPAAGPAPAAAAPAPDEALRLLALLQRDGRLVDFVSESLEGFGDADIGAAARTVHAGCKKVIASYLQLEPIYAEAEEARVTVAAGFDPSAVRLTGAVVGSPPFQGSLKHHGWRAVKVHLPPPVAGQDPRILAPAEVEL